MYEDKPPIEEVLEHHGIKGQKWGVRRFQNRDGTLTAAGKERYGEHEADKTINRKKGLTEKQKRAIKIGGAIAVSILAAYGTYKFADSGELNRLTAKGKAFLNGTKTVDFKRDERLSERMSADEIAVEAFSRINDGRYGSLGRTRNCRRCTFAYEMLRRGYDVEATATLQGTGQSQFGAAKALGDTDSVGKKLLSYFKSTYREISANPTASHIEELNNRSAEEIFIKGSKSVFGKGNDLSAAEKSKRIFDHLSQMPDRARGELSMSWTSGSAHSIAWEIIDGNPTLFDCQTNFMYSSPSELDRLTSVMSSANVTRLDNVDLNYDFISKWVKNHNNEAAFGINQKKRNIWCAISVTNTI